MIIDTHTHIFNFNDIPVKGNLDARIWKMPSIAIEKLVEHFIIKHESCWLDSSDNLMRDLTPENILNSIEKILQTDISEDTKNDVEQVKEFYMDFNQRNILYPLERLHNITFHLKEWLKLNMKSHNDIVKKMFNDYLEVDLFTPLMMDMEYWLKDKTIRTPFKTQVDCMKKLIIKNNSANTVKIHPFIAFNPERVRRNKEEEFEIIKNALENDGFIGIKLYSPLGYKPVNNNISESSIELSKNSREHGAQYDEILKELFIYCSEHKIPITTHCNSNGANAYSGSGNLAHPKYWEEVLDKEKFKDLKINFAHFGGDERLLNHRTDDANGGNWALKITQLMREHKNIYADLSYQPMILSSKKEDYVEELVSRCEDFPELKKRLMYGSDWHMLATTKHYENYLHEFQKIFNDNFFLQEREDFFSNNAINFLGLNHGGKTRDRLLDFYSNNHIDLPEWLTD